MPSLPRSRRPLPPRALATSTCIAALAFVLAPRSAHAGPEVDDDEVARFACGKPKASFEVAFPEEVGVRDLVTWAMSISCKRFVFGAGIASRSAKLTMITPGKIDAAGAWSLFEASLDAMGLAAVAKGPVYEIVETANAKEAALAIRTGFPDGGGGVTRLLLRPQHVAVEDLRAAIELVKSRAGVVTPMANLRALLITDDGRHIARMRTLVEALDRPGDGAGVWAVPVSHRDPTALIDVLTPMLADPNARPDAPKPPRLIADRRAGALFVVGAAADYQRVTALVGVLDRDQGDDATLTAVRLRNARATEVVTSLGPLVGGGGDGKAVGAVRLTADDGTNAVLIQASPQDALAVRAMLEELDAPRRQIYVEAMVLEVSTSASRKLGISWHGGDAGDDGSVSLGGFQTTTLASTAPEASLANAGSGLVAGILGSTLTSTLLGESVPSFGALLQAAATGGEIEVLASPHVMTLDNKPATISVGANIPYLSRAAVSNSLTSTGPSIDRKDLALSLKITPHIAPADPGAPAGSDRIRLDIDLVHNQLGETDFGGLGPTWKERKLETSVVVADQENLVLGGIIDERVEHSNERVPILGDLPLLGRLFRSDIYNRTKSNLLVVITPHLIDDSTAGRALFERRMREREEFLQARSSLTTRLAAPRLDYGKKRGLLAEIDLAVRAVEQERAARAALDMGPPPSGRVDVVAPAPTAAP